MRATVPLRDRVRSSVLSDPAASEAFTGTVLVVDDEKNIRRTLRMVLEGEGATVEEAETGERALELLEAAIAADAASFDEPGAPPSRLPNVVIMDVLLGGISGIEVLERLSALGEGGRPPVPVVMISGHASVADAVRATRLGAFDFFEKPLSA